MPLGPTEPKIGTPQELPVSMPVWLFESFASPAPSHALTRFVRQRPRRKDRWPRQMVDRRWNAAAGRGNSDL